ncbi:bifunctional diguanylate cyclase/phosphodiesterase [Massilia genomosp. 1]|uniref:EAL domain-containing protein n=1 Tax=Massilia genomosp. 1 TaxID=2609280 RepID=A0ABX0N428_9BURK|nr:EAL domain-containing protein [Massilia genomosp. 1]NHZ66770.1 EAL domain-containing protein [Massilia genomosp. 1]
MNPIFSLRLADRGERGVTLLVLGFAGLIFVGIIANLVFELVQARDNLITQKSNSARVLVKVLEEQAVDSIFAVDLAMQTTIKAVQMVPHGPADRDRLVDELLDSSITKLPFIRAIWLLDAEGNMIHDSQKLPGSYNLSDRAYFRIHREQPTYGMHIEGPIISKLGVPFISFSRRINRPDGSFGGVIVAALEPKYLRRFYDAVKVGKDGIVALVRTDGVLMLRVPAAGMAEGKRLAFVPNFHETPGVLDAGSYIADSNIDQIRRLYFYQRVNGRPLVVVVVGLGEDELLADWYGMAGAYIGVSLAFLVVLAGLSSLALRELHKRFRLNLALIGSWRLDLKSRSGHWSEQMYRLLGLPPADQPPPLDVFLQQIHPHDRHLVESAVQHGMNWAGELRSNPALGPQRTFHSRSTGVHDAAGNVIALIGTLQDVTERRQSNEKLELAARVFEYTRDGIVVTDAASNIVAVNGAFERITQYSESEVLGRNIRILRSNLHGIDFYRQVWETVARDGHWRGEIWNRRKNGEVFPEWLTVSAVASAEHGMAGYVGVFTDLSDITEANEQLQFMVNHDPLTRLPNRSLLNDRLEQAIEAAHQAQRAIAVLLLNIDRLQRVNDSIGHDAGDLLLREMAQRLLARLHPGDTLARIGSDEFVLVLGRVDDNDDINAAAQQMLGTVAAPCQLLGIEVVVTASVGIALFPLDGITPGDLIRNADTALSHVKNSGRNSFRYFTSEMNTRALHWMALEHRLRSALGRSEFSLFYQPQLRLADMRVCGAEALIRWRSAELGMVSPAEFIPLAEDSGLIVEIGEWVIRTACAQNKAWQDAGLCTLPVAVNVSAHQITAGTLPAIVSSALRASGMQARYLAIELTESVLMQEAELAMAQIAELRGMGVAVALDDFGTGYSSLSYLSRFALDKLKIDQSFVRNITEDAKSAAIAKATIALAHGLGITVVAEGVETRAQRDYLDGAGCDEVQGYFFSRPVAADEFVALLAADTAPSDQSWRAM